MVAVCCHLNSSKTNKESFEHCSLTPKSPQTYPRVFPSLLNVTGFSICLLLAKFCLILIYNPRFSTFETKSQCKTSYVVFERTYFFRIGVDTVASSKLSVFWMFRDMMSAIQAWRYEYPHILFFSHWRHLLALHRIDIEQGSPLITRINFATGLELWIDSPIKWHQGAVSIRKTVLPGMAIPMLKIRRPNGRLIFNMEIAIRR